MGAQPIGRNKSVIDVDARFGRERSRNAEVLATGSHFLGLKRKGPEITLSPKEEARYWDVDEFPGEGKMEGDDELVVNPSTGVVVSREEWVA